MAMSQTSPLPHPPQERIDKVTRKKNETLEKLQHVNESRVQCENTIAEKAGELDEQFGMLQVWRAFF